MVLACLERHNARWRQTAFELFRPGKMMAYIQIKKWFEDRGDYLRSEYRALIDREFKLPSR